MKHILAKIVLTLGIHTLLVTQITAQEFAPASLPFPSIANFAGTGTSVYPDDTYEFEEDFPIFIHSANKLIVSSNYESYAEATYVYTKTGFNSATIQYNISEGSPPTQHLENHTIQIQFIAPDNGTYTSTASISGYDGPEYPFSYTESTSGVFNIKRPVTSPSIPVTDNFDDNLKDANLWGDDFHDYSDVPGVLEEANQRLVFRSTSRYGDISRPYRGNAVTYDKNCEIIVDVSNLTDSSMGEDDYRFSDLGISIEPQGDSQDFLLFTLYQYQSAEASDKRFYSGFNGSDFPRVLGTYPSNVSSLRIFFDANRKVFTCFIDPDGPLNGYQWLETSSFGINGTGGETANTNWGLSNSNPMLVSLYASSSDALSTDTVYFDNFRIATSAADTPLAAWQRQHFGDPSSPNAALLLDKENDGISNLLEYAFHLDPTVAHHKILGAAASSSGLPWVRTVGTSESPRLRIEYIRRKLSANPGITYQAQFGSNLNSSVAGSWQNATTGESVTSIDATFERVVIEDMNPSSSPVRFGRVQVITNP